MRISKIWLLPLIIVFAVAFSPALAQETMPAGGDGFEGAVELSPGSYTDGEITDETSAYYLLENVEAGQGVFVEAVIEDMDEYEYLEYDLKIYNEDRKKIVSSYLKSGEQKIKLHWMPGTKQEGTDYYLGIETGNIWPSSAKPAGFSLDYKVENYFDAGSERDAGDSLDQALQVSPGSYSGHLLSSSYEGADIVDTYELAVKEGEKLTAEVTPPTDGVAMISFFNKKRQLLVSQQSSNPGAVTEEFFAPPESGNYFVKVQVKRTEEGEVVDYDVDFALEEAEQEEIPAGETTEDTTSGEMQDEIPQEIREDLPEEIKGKSPEEIREYIRNNYSEQVYQNFLGVKEGKESAISALKSFIFGVIKTLLMWLVGIIIVIGVIIWLVKRGGSSEEESSDSDEDKGPNKSDN